MVYIGLTTRPLNERFAQHSQDHNKCTSKALFDSGEVRIELIELCPCLTEAQLCRREGEIMKLYPNRVNKCLAGRTAKEYHQDSKP